MITSLLHYQITLQQLPLLFLTTNIIFFINLFLLLFLNINQHLTSDLNMPSISCSVPVSHQEHKRFNMKVEPGEYVQMTCNPDITMIDIIPNLKGLEIGNIKVISRLNCPVPSFCRLNEGDGSYRCDKIASAQVHPGTTE